MNGKITNVSALLFNPAPTIYILFNSKTRAAYCIKFYDENHTSIKKMDFISKEISLQRH